VRRVRDLAGSWALARCAAAVLAFAWCGVACAETQVYLVRGLFGVFSTGMDTMAEQLREKGIKAEAIGHLSWKSAVAAVVKEREGGGKGRLVLVGHSQGGNNVVDMARELEGHKIPVDLLITLAPFQQDPVPANVARAVNYYQSGGWGSPLEAVPAFKGELRNVDLSGDSRIFHVNIDKSRKVQALVVGEITALK
jgi:hypothetical protein